MSTQSVNMRAPRCSLPLFVVCLVALSAAQSGAFLVNYQSANLGLLPNGYNAAASNLGPSQQQDPNQYPMNANEQTAIQQQSQDQYATNQGQMSAQNGAANYPMPSYPANKNNLQQQQQTMNGISERDAQTPIFRLQGSALNSSSVKLFWSLESDYVARVFEIKYGPVSDHEKFSQPLNGSAREAIVSSLQPDTLYGFTLTGYPAEGSGSIWRPRYFSIKTPRLNEQSSQAVRQLVEDGSITPLGVKAEAKSNQTIQLTWTEQERPVNVQNLKRYNIIRYHVVNVDSPQTNTDQQQQQQLAAEQTNSSLPAIKYHYLNVSEDKIRGNGVVIQKLQPATEYAFAVKTAYVAPDTKKIYRHSGYSMDTSAKTFDLEPSPPRYFDVHPDLVGRNESEASKTSTNIKLTWMPPESPNGKLRGYVILWTLNLAEKKWDEIQVNDPNATAWFLESLTPSSTYHFKMRAINQRGPSQDSVIRSYATLPSRNLPSTPPIPTNNILMMIVLCLILVLFVLFLIVSLLFCRSRSGGNNKTARRKGLLRIDKSNLEHETKSGAGGNLLQSSTVAGRVGTLARRSRLQQSDHGSNGKPDFWISAIDQQQAFAAANSAEIKSQLSEKSGSDINMAAMVSIQRDSPQQFTTQTAHLPEYRFTSGGNAQQQQHLANAEHQLMQQLQQGHYHTGNQFAGALAFDQMDNATASALMTLSKRQQQQLQKYQMQFAGGGVPANQPPSPHQQPPPPPPLNIEQQQQQQQPLYGTHQQPGGTHLTSTRSLRVHRPILYDPVSGSFAQQDTPPNYNSHLNSMLNGVHHQLQSFNSQSNGAHPVTSGSSTLQFHTHHPHQTSTLMSRRSTNTLRSFQSSGGSGLYGQLGGQFAAPPVPPTSASGGQPHLLQNHQAVINQLNQASYTSLPLKHVSTVRPQIMSSLEDQIEMELAEKQAEQQHQQSQQQGPPSSTQQEQQT